MGTVRFWCTTRYAHRRPLAYESLVSCEPLQFNDLTDSVSTRDTVSATWGGDASPEPAIHCSPTASTSGFRELRRDGGA